jgi:hypothetical protein
VKPIPEHIEAQIDGRIRRLVALGILEDSGERTEDGRIIWRNTPLGKKLGKLPQEQREAIIRDRALDDAVH